MYKMSIENNFINGPDDKKQKCDTSCHIIVRLENAKAFILKGPIFINLYGFKANFSPGY